MKNHLITLLVIYSSLTLSMDTNSPFIFEPSYKASVFGQLKSLIRQGKWKKAFTYEPQIRKLHHNEWEKIVRCCAAYKISLAWIRLMYENQKVAECFQAMKSELQEITQQEVAFEAAIHVFRQKEFSRWRDNKDQDAPSAARIQAFALVQHWFYDQKQQLAVIQKNITDYAQKDSNADILRYIDKKQRRVTLFWNRLDEIAKDTWDKHLVENSECSNAPIWKYTRKNAVVN